MSKMNAAVIFATVFTMVAAGGNVLPRECEADHECANSYCYVAIGKCTPCTDCSTYMRHPPKWSTCAKSAQECGSCLNGYEEEVFTIGAKRTFCIPSKRMDELTTDNGENPQSMVVLYSVAGTLLLLLFISTVALVYYFKWCRKRKPDTSDHPTLVENLESAQPPPYSSTMLLPSAPAIAIMDETEPEISKHLLHVVETKDTGLLQQAVPFQVPLAPYWDESEESDAQENEDEEDECPNFEYHNAETMPSDWTPGESEESDAQENEDEEDDYPNFEYHNAETMSSDWTPGDYPGCVTTVNEAPEPEGAGHSSSDVPASVTSPTSSASSLNEEGAVGISLANRRSMVDSGVSAATSSQSVSSGPVVRYFRQFGIEKWESTSHSTDTASPTVSSSLPRSRSQDDISSSNHGQPPKRPRRDSGSMSMESAPLDDEYEPAQNPFPDQNNI